MFDTVKYHLLLLYLVYGVPFLHAGHNEAMLIEGSQLLKKSAGALNNDPDCPVCYEELKDTIRTPCEHRACSKCAVRWYAQSEKCHYGCGREVSLVTIAERNARLAERIKDLQDDTSYDMKDAYDSQAALERRRLKELLRLKQEATQEIERKRALAGSAGVCLLAMTTTHLMVTCIPELSHVGFGSKCVFEGVAAWWATQSFIRIGGCEILSRNPYTVLPFCVGIGAVLLHAMVGDEGECVV